ncbi:MAG: MFS transporter [Pseudomonadota bacterium]
MTKAFHLDATQPGAKDFAVLFGLEYGARALVTVALPVQTLEIVGKDEKVSLLFFLGATISILMVFAIPYLARWLGRARICSIAFVFAGIAYGIFMLQELPSQIAGFALRACGIAVLSTCLNMFIMDRIRRHQLGHSEPLRMLAVGLALTIGPLLGVALSDLWGHWAPFAASAMVMVVVLLFFWARGFHRLEVVQIEAPPATRPLPNLSKFFAQPRLTLAWLMAVGRGFFWASFFIYTPLYAVETGLGTLVGGFMVSLGSVFMLLMPLWGWAARRHGIRKINLVVFPAGATALFLAGFLPTWPIAGALCIVAAACAMTVVDGYGNSLFYRACKPSQRPTMTPLFSTHRDLADLLQAGIFSLLLIVFPVPVVFLVLGIVLFALAVLSFSIHRRL